MLPPPAGTAVLASLVELVLVSLAIRHRHRLARSALGRLYGAPCGSCVHAAQRMIPC